MRVCQSVRRWSLCRDQCRRRGVVAEVAEEVEGVEGHHLQRPCLLWPRGQNHRRSKAKRCTAPARTPARVQAATLHRALVGSMKIAKQSALYSQHFAHPNQPNCILVASGVVRIILYCKFDRASSWMCAASCYSFCIRHAWWRMAGTWW